MGGIYDFVAQATMLAMRERYFMSTYERVGIVLRIGWKQARFERNTLLCICY